MLNGHSTLNGPNATSSKFHLKL